MSASLADERPTPKPPSAFCELTSHLIVEPPAGAPPPRRAMAPNAKPANPQTAASANRFGSRPRRKRARSAPDTPTAPQPAICQTVHGPCDRKMLETIAVTAPTAKPGIAPRAKPANSTMSVVGFTLGIAD